MKCSRCHKTFEENEIINEESDGTLFCDKCFNQGMELDREYALSYAHACGYKD